MDKVPYFLLNIIDSLILLAVLLIAMIVMLIRFRSLGKAALFGVAGFVMLAISLLIDIGQGVWTVFIYDRSLSGDIFETVYWIKTGFATLFSVIGLVLLIVAIITKRPMTGSSTSFS